MKVHYINGPGLGALCNHPKASRISPDWHKVTCIQCLNHLVNLCPWPPNGRDDPPPYDGVVDQRKEILNG